MQHRFWGLVGLGCVSFLGIHGCSSDEPAEQGSGAKGGKGSAGKVGGGAGGKAGGGGSGAKSGSSGSTAKGGKAGSGSGAVGNEGGGAGEAGRAGETGRGGRGGGGGRAGSDGGAAPQAGAAGEAGEAGAAGAAGDTSGPCEDSLNLPLLTEVPANLYLTGLYTSETAVPSAVAPYVREFAPTYPLWSDGALKRRWVYLPACTQIDTSDMDHWEFPVGTRFWKEFTVPGAGVGADVLVETRFIHRFGPGPNDWLFAAYQWDQTGGSGPTAGNTTSVPGGIVDANGTTHDIPNNGACTNCHGKLPERILGFSAFELTKSGSGSSGDLSIRSLSEDELLTVPAPDGFHPPGNALAQAGLGYLHANCGICHNSYFNPTGDPAPHMRLLTGQTTVTSADTYTSLANIPTVNPNFNTHDRIEPGSAATSSIVERMNVRVAGQQMPPVGTEVVDPDGVDDVSAWINDL